MTHATQTGPMQSPSNVSIATKVTLLSCAVFTLLTGASVSPALPAISAHFANDPNSELLSKLVLTVSPLFIAIGGPIWGLIIDRVGRKPVLAVSVVGTALFGVIAAFMGSLWGLIICRALLGLAVAGVTSASYTLMIDYFEGTERHRFMGLQTAVQKVGGLGFVMLGGLLAAISWRATFAVDVIALLVLPGILLFIHEPAVRARNEIGARADKLVNGLSGSVMLVVWAVAFLSQVIFFTLPTQLPFLLTDRIGASPQLVGMALAASTLMSATSATLFHRFKRHFSHGHIFAIAAALVGVSFVAMSRADALPFFFASLAVGGLGFGLILPNLTVWLAEATPEALRGRAIGFMMTGNFLGQFMSPLLAEPIIRNAGINGLFVTISAFALLMAVVFTFARMPGASPIKATTEVS
jgi:MFS family permease